MTDMKPLLYPMFAMVLLITLIGVIALTCRFKSVKDKPVRFKYYRLMQGDDVPEIITKTTRCFNNMFEVPVLFFVASTLFISLKVESSLALIFAWCFVGFRYAQAYIHLTYNNVIHRMLMFWFAFVCVLAMWVTLVVHQV